MASVEEIRRKLTLSDEILDDKIEIFLRRLERFVNRNLDSLIRAALDGNPDALTAANSLSQIQNVLREAGLGSIVDDLTDIYGVKLRELKSVFEAAGGARFVLNEVDVAIIQELIAYDASAVANRINLYVSDINATVFNAVVAGQSPVISEILDGPTDGVFANLRTELNTALSGFSNAVNQRKAEEAGLEWFVYTGGLIKTSRPFCVARDGKIFHKREIEQWDNGQGLPVIPYLGGYNCRHQLIGVTTERAKELGANV